MPLKIFPARVEVRFRDYVAHSLFKTFAYPNIQYVYLISLDFQLHISINRMFWSFKIIFGFFYVFVHRSPSLDLIFHTEFSEPLKIPKLAPLKMMYLTDQYSDSSEISTRVFWRLCLTTKHIRTKLAVCWYTQSYITARFVTSAEKNYFRYILWCCNNEISYDA